MKKIKVITPLVLFVVITILSLTIWSCERQKINRIKGNVIGYEYCTSEYYGYLIEVQSPAEIGGSVSIDGIRYENVVKTYSKPNTELHIGSEVKGTYQMTSDCRICQDLYIAFDLPEVIIKYKQ